MPRAFLRHLQLLVFYQTKQKMQQQKNKGKLMAFIVFCLAILSSKVFCSLPSTEIKNFASSPLPHRDVTYRTLAAVFTQDNRRFVQNTKVSSILGDIYSSPWTLGPLPFSSAISYFSPYWVSRLYKNVDSVGAMEQSSSRLLSA